MSDSLRAVVLLLYEGCLQTRRRPDCIEETYVTKLGAAAMRSFNRINPINLDFEEMLREEEAEQAKAAADAAAKTGSP